jgi:uncharacterized membrane protein
MKKFMFSAVALIAFSFAGMANTGGEITLNNDVVLTVEKQVTEKIVFKKMWNECDQLAQDVWDAYKAANMSDTSAGNASSNAYHEYIGQ